MEKSMQIPAALKYTANHEWVKINDDGSLTVGITEYGQDLLGDMVYVENPVPGRKLTAGEACAVVESVKAASDVHAPVDGEVLAVNIDLDTSPEAINKDAWRAWLFTMQPAQSADMAGLLDAAAYQALIAS